MKAAGLSPVSLLAIALYGLRPSGFWFVTNYRSWLLLNGLEPIREAPALMTTWHD